MTQEEVKSTSEHHKLMTTAKLKRISGYIDEILASISTKDCCDYTVVESVRSINNDMVNLYDYVVNMPEDDADEGENTEESDSIELNLAIKED